MEAPIYHRIDKTPDILFRNIKMSKIISVYFNGTDDTNRIPEQGMRISLATKLARMTIKSDGNESICVNGCGMDNKDIRDLGMIFSYHLANQVSAIARKVEDRIKTGNEKIILNVYGFSRGGAAAFLLCQKLKHISAEYLTINVAAVEPVPGNMITGVYGDVLLGTNCTLSAAVADLTECKNIGNMLILLTNEPLPDMLCHAPILPALPDSCQAEIDVTPGCHKGAVAFRHLGDSIGALNDESAVVFHRVIEFMKKCGTSFDYQRRSATDSEDSFLDQDEIRDVYQRLATKASFQSEKSQLRHMHLYNAIFTATGQKKYVNRHHQMLSDPENLNDEDCLMTVKNRNPRRITPQYRHGVVIMEMVFVLAVAAIIYSKINNVVAEYKKPGL
jgi:hypothetical protein